MSAKEFLETEINEVWEKGQIVTSYDSENLENS